RIAPEGDDWFRIEVEDTGIGVAASDLPRLFVEFQQLDASSAKRHQGTGLGLALTKRIVEAHGGRVEVRSVVGQGSVFAAVLPRSWASGRAGPGAPAARAPAPNAPTVLVIEDDAADREWLVGVLRGAGFAVDTAASGAEAIARCRSRSYSAL